MRGKRTLGRKILLSMLVVVLGVLIAAAVVFGLTIRNISRTQVQNARELNSVTGIKSSSSISDITKKRLLELAIEKADNADGRFSEFEHAVRIVADNAAQIYSEPEAYLPRTVELPDPAKDGSLSLQVLYSAQTDPADPAVVQELGLIGNIGDTLISVNRNQESIASIYVATETGLMVQADYISAAKYDASGQLMPLEAKERPWYIGAAESLAPYFTPVTRDVHTPRLAIMCGVPVVADGELRGVAGAGMYLDDMEDLVQSVDLGSGGSACIINRSGQVLFSTMEDGILAAGVEGVDLRESEDEDLASMIKLAVGGRTGIIIRDINGIPCYVSFAPLRTVGWALLLILPQSEVDAPTVELLASLSLLSDRALEDANGHIRQATYLLAGLFLAAALIAAAIAVILSRQVVKPIHALTEEVRSLEGDNLDFHWDMKSGDETQLLADAFESLTLRMKNYISDIQTITAERERIGVELTLAQRIQEAMLPRSFPAFPGRTDFDIYASMDPAREVGGDFYDYFLLDDDHLYLAIADVSGKGIPASLFMMISKTVLASYARESRSPAEILRMTNESICANNPEDMFVTVWAGILELSTGRLTAASAGHEFPAVMHPGGGFELLRDRHGFVIGGFEGSRYTEYELQLEPGSRIFVYTDGLPEAQDAGDEPAMFGTERMLEALNTDPQAGPEQILNHVSSAVDLFVQGAEQFDDLTMLCLEYSGPAGGMQADEAIDDEESGVSQTDAGAE